MFVSKSRRTSFRNAAKSTEHANAPAGGSSRRRASERHRISFKRALAALHDLADWALGLAERDVADWPEGRRRVRTSRRYILAQLRGERSQSIPVEDALFTVGLLARIFEGELGLPMTELLVLLDQIGISSKNVPISVRPSSAAEQRQAPASAASALAASCMASVTPLRSRRAPVQPAPVPACDRCGHPDLRFRVAA